MYKVIVFSVGVILSGCNSDHTRKSTDFIPQEISFRPILCPEVGSSTSIIEPQQLVINDENNYLHHIEASDLEFSGEIPEVDFTNELVIAVNGGQQYSQGYQVEVIAAMEYEDNILITVDSISPPNDCATNDALSAPYCIVTIANSNKNIEFEIIEREECGI